MTKNSNEGGPALRAKDIHINEFFLDKVNCKQIQSINGKISINSIVSAIFELFVDGMLLMDKL